MIRIVTDVLQFVTNKLQSYFTKNGQYKHQVYMYVSEKLRLSESLLLTLWVFIVNNWYWHGDKMCGIIKILYIYRKMEFY